MLDVIVSCILQIYDKKGEEVFDAKDQTQEELTDFIEQLNSQQFKEIQKFFDTMPKLKHTITVKNPNTKVKNEIVIEWTKRFFRIALSHSSLENYYDTSFALMQHHNYSLSDLDNMMPWEREIYTQMLLDFIKEQNKKTEAENRS